MMYVVYLPEFDSIIETFSSEQLATDQEVKLEISGIQLGTGIVLGAL